MTASASDIFRVVGDIEHDLRRANARFTELRSMLAALNLPNPTRPACPECGLTFVSRTRLTDHLHVTHGKDDTP